MSDNVPVEKRGLIYGPPEFRLTEMPDVRTLLQCLGLCKAEIVEHYPPAGFNRDGSRNESEPVKPRAFLRVRVFDKQGRYLGPIGCVIDDGVLKNVDRVAQERQRCAGIVERRFDGGTSADDFGPVWNDKLREIIKEINAD